MKIAGLTAFPISFPIPEDKAVTLGIGRAIKRDAVLVKVVTDDGLVGWGEAHAGRAPGALAQLANTTLKTLILGMDAADVVGVWDRVYKMQLASHGMGAAAAIALSGIDMALWDIRGKAVGWPLYRLLGGGAKPIAAYGGGVSLGYQPPDQLAAEAEAVVSKGYRALKLRLGDTPRDDIARVQAVRKALGDEIDILTDANAAYSLADARRVMPALDEASVGWLEEPFPPHDHRRYREARSFAFPLWFWLPLRIALGITKPRRHVLGAYFAGEVDAVVIDESHAETFMSNAGVRFLVVQEPLAEERFGIATHHDAVGLRAALDAVILESRE